MYTMSQVCKLTNLNYETLKYYCNEGLIPNVKRNKNNYRIFDESNIEWIKSISCLKDCGMSIKEIKHFFDLCHIGESTIKERQEILLKKKDDIYKEIAILEKSITFLENKYEFYNNLINKKVD